MPFCPVCRAEYRPGFKICSDCNEPLTEQLPALINENEMIYADPTVLCSAQYGLKADMLIAALKEQDIPAKFKHRGTGQYLSLYMGASYQSGEIIVPSCMLEKAKLIMNNISDVTDDIEITDSYNTVDEDDRDEEVELELQKHTQKREKAGWILLAIFLGVPSFLIILIALISYLFF